jgi:hypothetical protein
MPQPALIAAAPGPPPQAEQTVFSSHSPDQEEEGFWDKVVRHALRPFRQFTLLWCLLLLLTTHRWLLGASLLVVSAQLLSLLIGIVALSFTSTSWFSKLSRGFQEMMEKLIVKVVQAKDFGVTQEVRNAWSALRFYLIGLNFLQDRRRFAQWTVVLAAMTFIVVYLYLALVFSFEYYGIARLEGIRFAWGDSLITALFIPIAYPDLPAARLLKLAGGIQWASVILLGTSTVVNVFREKLQPVYAVVNTITRKMEEDEIKATLTVIKDELARPPAPAGGPSK